MSNAFNIQEIFAVIAMIAAAGERGTEILRKTFNLTERIPKEHTRNVVIQIICLLVNIVVSFGISSSSETLLPPWLQNWWGIIIMGLMANGGSNAWHSVLAFGESIKTKKEDATSLKGKIGF